MLKTTGLFRNLALKLFKTDGNKVVKTGNNKVDKTINNLFKFEKLKNEKLKNSTCIGAIREYRVLNTDAKKVFNNLKQVFIEVLVFWHFNLESYIYIKIDGIDYIISKLLGQLSDDLITLDKPN